MNGHYSSGDVVLGNWTLVRPIGEGSYGKVFEAEREDFGVTYKAAIKIITIPQSDSEVKSARAEGMDEESVTAYFRSFVEEIVQEFVLMSKLKGTSNVVSYEDHTVVPHEDQVGWDIIIRMELLTPLLDHLQNITFTRKDVIRLGIDICKALELCQKYNIVHRDIKPENIFVSELGDYKLGDFGIARTVEKTTGGLSKKGTYTYMAPEVYKDGRYNSNVDIYSLGIVMYRLLNENRAPFLPAYPAPITHSDRENSMAKRMSGAPLPPPKNADGRLAEIVLKACAYQPKERYSAPMQMRQELEAILYDRSETPIIYPNGDEVPLRSVENIPTGQSGSVPTAEQADAAEHDASPERTEYVSEERSAAPADRTEAVSDSAAPAEKKPKKKFPVVPIAIGGAALALVIGLAAMFGGGGDKPSDSSSGNSSGSNGVQGSAPAVEIQDDGFMKLNNTFDSMLWGQYIYDELVEKNGSYETDLESFMKDMKYETFADKEVSCVPYYIMSANPGWRGTREAQETLHQQYLDEGYDEQYWNNWLEGARMSQIKLAYCDKVGDTWIYTFFYKVEGNKLQVLVDGTVDERTFEVSGDNWLEYEFGFKGRNLILTRNGCSVEMAPWEFSKKSVYQNWIQRFDGYAANDAAAYNEIVSLTYYHDGADPADDYSGYVKFADGGSAIDPVFTVGDDGTLEVTWKSAYRPYNGKTHKFEEEGSVSGNIIVCSDYGFLLVVDGNIYPYQATSGQYRESKLGDVLDGTSAENLDDSQVEQLMTTQSSILEDLEAAFKEANVDADIDSATGKVTMDASILFALDDATLSDEGMAYLDSFLDLYTSVIMSDKYSGAIASILVEGHTDTNGGYDYNMTLSQERAQAVVNYCLSRQPALSEVIAARGRSFDDPVYGENGEVDMAASRRVQFRFILNVDA